MPIDNFDTQPSTGIWTFSDGLVDPSVDSNLAIRLASKYGHVKLVKFLLADDRVNPADYDPDALIEAIKNGHL
jgi:hypothetical protein